MNAAVLCPGPSVQRYPINGDLRVSEFSPEPRPYDLIVGVNRAATLHACDFWCLLDHYTFALDPPVIGTPTIVCHAAIYNAMAREFPEAKNHKHLSLENINEDFQTCNWRNWSASLGIMVAVINGANVVECYGMDWCGTDDWDGFNHEKHRRGTKRWASERKLFQQMTDWLAERGCVLRRVGVAD